MNAWPRQTPPTVSGKDLASSYQRLGPQQRTRYPVKPNAPGESLKIIERLVLADPTNSEWQRDLAISYSNRGDLSSARGAISVKPNAS